MKSSILVTLLSLVGLQCVHAAEPADLIVHKAKVVTVDAKFHIAEAVAVKDGRILAVGKNDDVLKWRGPKTRLIDAERQDRSARPVRQPRASARGRHQR